ncbi:uncharacterized protein AB675_3356 [Cyphellophora attinorum]|uniref:PIPK domain-containing protein n=1 Tax=Cyphellophora attinorum TaxID=1664694 RepID=A0A0N1HPG6_9EURO|nr:uncharacterized protein AB675_3356 [Phialophora attinorum]KPI39627.1 hypothetical protein AB675_3356 [Phialophora attinorum]
MARNDAISRSIVAAVLKTPPRERLSLIKRVLIVLSAFFTLFQLRLTRIKDDVFERLRTKSWEMDDEAYRSSFSGDEPLETKGDMGYSGSSFFTTKDGKYLIKSVPRQFEHSYFRDDLLEPYAKHMEENARSLLIRITDFLGWKHFSIGGILGLVPTYHITMENLLIGQDEADSAGGGDWETFDLKPADYFFPERDIAGGKLASEATKSRLADKFDDKIVLSQEQHDIFIRQLEQDTTLLASHNAVDYSLFLVRIPLSNPQNPFADEPDHDNAPEAPDFPPFAPPSPPTWRTGVRSADGKYVFRAQILDFFWAKHKVTPKLFTFLIKAWNLIDRKGPMSITTTPDEYRERFLRMCEHFVEVKEDGEDEAS